MTPSWAEFVAFFSTSPGFPLAVVLVGLVIACLLRKTDQEPEMKVDAKTLERISREYER